jgi:NAD+ kinase
MILVDERNPTALALAKQLEQGIDFEEWDGPALVIGGDGFMLRSVAEHGPETAYLGLNAGHLGFLLNDVDDFERVLDQLLNRAWTEHSFPLLEARIHTGSDEVVYERAVNDVYLERSTGQTARLALSIDGHRVVDMIVADGIIFSTALGSTAYTFSAGGPACHPTLQLLNVTPICPHHPRLAPFALPAGVSATVEVIDPDRRPVRGVADGRDVDDIRSLTVGYGDERVRLAYLEGHDFTATMVTKILHP